jgi:hypothetical protein
MLYRANRATNGATSAFSIEKNSLMRATEVLVYKYKIKSMIQNRLYFIV